MKRVHVFKCTGCGYEVRITEENMKYVGGSVSCKSEFGLGCGFDCVEDRIEIEDKAGHVTAVIV